MEPPFRPPSFQFQEERLFSCTAESTFTARLNQQATMASSSTTDQPTSEHLSHSSDENSNVSITDDQEGSDREVASITESVVFSAQGHPPFSSRSSSSTSSLVTAGAGFSGTREIQCSEPNRTWVGIRK